MRLWLKHVLIGLIIRLILAPFFMHTWDIGTIYESSQQFLTGQGVYDYVNQMTALIRQESNMPYYYYGFAYLPQTLLIFAPFYWIYTQVFPSDAIMDFRAVEFTYPQIFGFLFLIKIPIILGDTFVIYLLTKREPKTGLFYALNPYILFISVFWGNFDPLVGLFILTSYLYFNQNRELSGFLYGLSLIKMYPIVLFPLLIVKGLSSWKGLIRFLLGFMFASIPILYYLIYAPSSFLDVVVFQGSRPVNGVNIYNVVLSAQGIFLQTTITKIASLALAIAIISVTYVSLKRQLSLLNSMIALMLAYIVFAPVTNEQYLAALMPLALLSPKFNSKTWVFPLIFSTLHATYVYFAIPLFWITPVLRMQYTLIHAAFVEAIGPFSSYMRYFVSLCFAFFSLRNIHDHVQLQNKPSDNSLIQIREVA